VRIVERARIVLCAGGGLTGHEIAERVGCSLPTVVKWRGRYACDGIDGLKDAPRSGAPLTHGPETRALLIAKACTRPEPTEEGARRERWTYRELAEEVGVSESQAHVILQRAEIKPHRTDYWIMTDFSQPEFEQRCADVCGLYVNPPENVLVLSIDEKTGIQAKSPVKPDVPPAPGRPARPNHRQPLHPRHRERREVAGGAPSVELSVHPQARVLAQPDRDLLLDPRTPAAKERHLH
jgi:transposase